MALPEWRNWQTRYVQGVVGITLVRVQIPPSAPDFLEYGIFCLIFILLPVYVARLCQHFVNGYQNWNNTCNTFQVKLYKNISNQIFSEVKFPYEKSSPG